MDPPAPCFAFRFWQIKPQGPWTEHTARDPPRPPDQWRKTGFEQPWHGWTPGRTWPLSDSERLEVRPRRATSIMWCQPRQNYWVIPNDCTIPQQNGEPVEGSWHILFFHDLGDGPESKPGLWKLLEHGSEDQHSANCPDNFEEFLPKNFFRGTDPREDAPCHLIGNLSLILGLHAMIPRKENDIVEQIERCFFHGNNPCLVPSKDHNKWSVINRYGEF